MLNLTPKAIERIRTMFASNGDAKGKCLRIGLEAAGCNGQKYAFKFDDKKPDDVSFPQPGFEVVVDPQSLTKLDEATVDFFEDDTSSEFKVTNPKEKTTCACGESKTF